MQLAKFIKNRELGAIRSIIAFGFEVIGLAVVASAQAKSPLNITISGPANPIHAGTEIDVQIVVTNISNREIVLHRAVGYKEAYMDYKIMIVEKSTGRLAKNTELGDRLDGKGKIPLVGSFHITKLAPNESILQVAPINKIADLSNPGIYSVQAKREIPKEAGGGTAESNVINIQIVP